MNGSSLIDEIVRVGARRMPAAALEAEVNAYIAELADQRDEHGRRLVVRNGYHQPRKVTTAAGVVGMKAPRANDKRVDEEARADGGKELVALKDGYRESGESWADLLRDCARRGMRAPILTVGDGALGFWKALAEVFPASPHQRCWVHKTANVLNALPKSAHPGARQALQDIYNAEDRDHAETAIKTFAQLYGAKFPQAVKKITDDQEELLAFLEFPAEHWIHLRTTNPIESIFSTVRLRTKVTRGAGSRAAALAMAFKLVESAQQRWRAVNAPHMVALVGAGARFERGQLVERPDESGGA
ncbi:IS256 family transposase [Streptomyces sp. NPDC001492]